MEKYVVYRFNYRGLIIQYFITTRTFYKNIEHNVVVIKICKEVRTIKYLELQLSDKDKLNKECQDYIKKYICDFCENKLKEELL